MSTFEMQWVKNITAAGGTLWLLYVDRGFGDSWQGSVSVRAHMDVWEARYWFDSKQTWQLLDAYELIEDAKTACENCARINAGEQQERTS